MSLVKNLFRLAVAPALDSAAPGAEAGIKFIVDRFADRSQRLNTALGRAHDRTWRVLEMALAGDSLWQRLKGALAAGEEKAMREQVQALLAAAPLPESKNNEQVRQAALKELQAARSAGMLSAVSIDPRNYQAQAGAFSSFGDATKRLQAEQTAVREVGVGLQQAGYKYLGWVVAQATPGGPPLLVLAFRYFFRREVETDEELARGLTFSQLESLSQHQEAALRGLDQSLRRHMNLLQQQLAGLLGVAVEARDAAVAGMQTALDIQAEQQRQGGLLTDLYQTMQQLLEENRMQARPVRQGDSLSIRDGRERKLVKDLLARYRGLPAEQRRATPALANGLGRLGLAVGELDEAQEAFAQAASHAGAAAARAEAHYNAYRAALERGDLPRGLKELLRAVELDPERFTPFPTDKYAPERILGVGGFGATFLCKHHLTGAPVAIKSLLPEGLDREVSTVFQEAAALEQVPHAGIIRVRDYGFADHGKTRPYIVMEYFDGDTLEDHVKKHRCLTPEELLPLARAVAEALQSAHQRGILHRDVKPANLLVRRAGGAWEVRLIDFGLALKQSVLESAGTSARQGQTIMGSAIAGTLEYAAPEQMGRIPGARIGPPADVYGFGKLCCYALFESAEPTFQDYQKLPRGWAELIGNCLQKAPDKRPADFRAVLRQLEALSAPIPVVMPVSAPPPLPRAEVPVALVAEPRPRYEEPPPRRRVERDYDPPRRQPEGPTGGKRVACALLGGFGPLLAVTPFLMILEQKIGGDVSAAFGFIMVVVIAGGCWFGATQVSKWEGKWIGLLVAGCLGLLVAVAPFAPSRTKKKKEEDLKKLKKDLEKDILVDPKKKTF